MVVSQFELEEALSKQCEFLTGLFKTQKEELMDKFEEVQNKLIEEIALLKQDNVQAKKEAVEAKLIAQQNADEILRLKSTINTLVEQNIMHAKGIAELTESIESRTNRQLRNTLVFRGIPKG